MHECKFEDAVEQIGKDLTELKKIKLYLSCFNEEMQREMKFVGAADEKTGKKAFATRTEYAGWVTTTAEEIERAEARRGLFGMPGTRANPTKKSEAESGHTASSPSEPAPQEPPAAPIKKGIPTRRRNRRTQLAGGRGLTVRTGIPAGTGASPTGMPLRPSRRPWVRPR